MTTIDAQRPTSSHGSAAPLVAATSIGGLTGLMVGRANDLGGGRGALAGLAAGAGIGLLGYAGTRLAPRIGISEAAAERVAVGAGITGALMGTLHLHGALQMSNANGVLGSLAFVGAAALLGGAFGAGYHALRS